MFFFSMNGKLYNKKITSGFWRIQLYWASAEQAVLLLTSICIREAICAQLGVTGTCRPGRARSSRTTGRLRTVPMPVKIHCD